MIFPPMPLLVSLRNQIAPTITRNPLNIVRTVQKTEIGADLPVLMVTYTEAVNRFTQAAGELAEYARLLTDARNAYLLRQKEIELGRLRKEIDSLKLVIPLLSEDSEL